MSWSTAKLAPRRDRDPATKTLVSMTARTGAGVENIMYHSSCMTPQHDPHDTEKSVIRSSVGM
jgi:hypothetical protein